MLLNLNADLGESFGSWTMGDDSHLLDVVNTANVACGFHAGDPSVMAQTIEQALRSGVSIGAHPGFPDLQGFGRRAMTLPDAELYALIQYQLSALDGMSCCRGLTMTHVKPHGALNNMACENEQMASVVVEAVKHYNSKLILLAPVLSQLASAATQACLPVALEIFADRAYTAHGTLVNRRQPGAVIETADGCIAHVQSMIKAQGLVTQDGGIIPAKFHSICVHGDNAHAVQTARLIKAALLADGHELGSLPNVMSGR